MGAGVVLNRGKQLADFRPGLPLEEYRLDFEPKADGMPIKVVGNVEQLHLSRCYTQSKTLTCTTCHDPHGFPRPEERATYYRSICLNCHQAQQCTVGKEQLLQKSPDNDCTKCHMPRAATNVPHVSFAHHRIAVHERLVSEPSRPKATEGAGTVLVPFRDYVALGEMDRKRSVGLGFLMLADTNHSGRAVEFKNQAFKLLTAAHSAGLRDPVLLAHLARLRFEQGEYGATLLAGSALDFPNIAGTERVTALYVVAAEHFERKQYKEALAGFRDLVTLRRDALDWFMLAQCHNGLGNSAAMVQALEMALRINPRLMDVRRSLVEHYRRRGDEQRAAWHEQRVIE
jgi:predicted CXXCH cytochrome family protein